MVEEIVENTNALGVASSSFALPQTFRQKLQIVPNTRLHPLNLSVARRARRLPSQPMARFLPAIRQHPPN